MSYYQPGDLVYETERHSIKTNPVPGLVIERVVECSDPDTPYALTLYAVDFAGSRRHLPAWRLCHTPPQSQPRETK